MPTNAAVPGGGHTVLPGRTNGERVWARVVPRSPEVWYRWPDATVSATAHAGLAAMCRRVPYLGRSTSPALVELVEPGSKPAEGWLVPAGERVSTLGQVVRGAYRGALRALRDAHAEKITGTGPGDPWQVGVGVDYVPQQSVVATTPTTDGPYGDMVVLRFESRRLDGRHAARVAAHIRAALLSRATEHIATLHGHHDGSVVQVAFLPLPDVGHANADGHLLGVAIAVPPLPKRDLAVLAAALPPPGELLEIRAGPLGVLRLRRLSPLDVGATRGLDPQRWAGRAQDWVSVPPVVLDRYVRTDQAVVAEVIRAAVNAGLPEPQVLEVDRLPLLEGAPSLRPSDTLRRDDDRSGRPFRHVRLRFPGPISGPVVLGSMRHYGLGLCLPSPEPQ